MRRITTACWASFWPKKARSGPTELNSFATTVVTPRKCSAPRRSGSPSRTSVSGRRPRPRSRTRAGTPRRRPGRRRGRPRRRLASSASRPRRAGSASRSSPGAELGRVDEQAHDHDVAALPGAAPAATGGRRGGRPSSARGRSSAPPGAPARVRRAALPSCARSSSASPSGASRGGPRALGERVVEVEQLRRPAAQLLAMALDRPASPRAIGPGERVGAALGPVRRGAQDERRRAARARPRRRCWRAARRPTPAARRGSSRRSRRPRDRRPDRPRRSRTAACRAPSPAPARASGPRRSSREIAQGAISGSTASALGLARAFAIELGMRPFEIAESDRVAYHAAAAIASNFLVALAGVRRRPTRQHRRRGRPRALGAARPADRRELVGARRRGAHGPDRPW